MIKRTLKKTKNCYLPYGKEDNINKICSTNNIPLNNNEVISHYSNIYIKRFCKIIKQKQYIEYIIIYNVPFGLVLGEKTTLKCIKMYDNRVDIKIVSLVQNGSLNHYYVTNK